MFLCLLFGQMIGIRAQTSEVTPGSPPATSTPPATPTAAETTPKPSETLPTPPSNFPNIQYMKNQAGELVPVLKGVEFEGYLKYLDALRMAKSSDVEKWSIGRLALEGTSTTDFAELTAKIEIQILEESKTIFVPLRLGEATLRDEDHTGPGTCGLWKSDPEQGQIWWFRGAGKYELTLKLLVPVRTREAPNRRIQLSLPASTVSDLKLHIKAPRVRTLSEEGTARLQVTSSDGESTIELFGLGTKLDFSWQPIAQQNNLNPTFHSRTAMNVLIDGQSVLLEANQRIEPLQGEFSEITVRIPVGMELIKLEGTRYREHRIESQDQSLVRVLFDTDNRTAASPVDLKWLLRNRIPPDQSKVQIGGFEVEKGRIQSGIVVVRVTGAYRVQRLETQDRNVVRESLSGLDRMTNPSIPGASDPSNIVGVYRVLEQPFQLVLELKKIDAYVSAEQPQYVAHFSGNSLELEATYVLQVARGTVDNFVLDWPEWKKAGWSIDGCDVRRISDHGDENSDLQYDITLDSSEKDAVEVQPTEPVSGHIQIRLVTHRPIESGVQGAQIQFPELRNASSDKGVLVATLADNLDLDSKPAGTTTIRPLDPPRISSELLAEKQDHRRMAYQLNNFRSGLNVRTTVKPPSLSVESTTVVRSSERGLNLEQSLSYSISYQRFSQLMIWVPTSWVESCEYRLSTGEELSPVLTQTTEAGYQQVRLPLERPRSGNFQLQLRAQIDASELNRSSELQILLARPTEERLSRSRLQTQNLGGLDFSVDDDLWTLESGSDNVPFWTSPTVASQVRARVKLFPDTPTSGIVVSRAFIQTTVDGVGQEYHAGTFLLRGARGKIRFILPEGSELARTRVRHTEISAVSIPDLRNTYEVSLPSLIGAGSEGELVMECDYTHKRQSGTEFFHSVDSKPVSFGTGESWREVVWELILPPDENLFRSPKQLNPLYRWKLNGPLFTRVNSSDTESLLKWVGAVSQDRPNLNPEGWNKYVMSRFGSVPAVRFVTIRRHLIIAVGAGCALFFTVLLMNFPVMRHVLVFWVAGTLMAILSLWYPEPVILFLQPALIGFALGLLSSIGQLWWRRRSKTQIEGKTSAVFWRSSIAAPSRERAAPPSSVQPSTSLRGSAPVGNSGLQS